VRESRLVYSTGGDSQCPRCSKPLRKCRCRPQPDPAAGHDGIVRISRETRGRKGKGVTIITGLTGQAVELKKTAKALKALCSSGGSIKDGHIEIQGDHRHAVMSYLKQSGHKVKLAGG